MIFGDLFLADIRAYREQKLAGTGITPVFPLWDRPTPELAQAMIASGLEAFLATVDLKKLPAEFAGRKFDAQLLADLPEGVDPCGENGEFHTCVVAGPMFAHRLAVTTGERVERDAMRIAIIDAYDATQHAIQRRQADDDGRRDQRVADRAEQRSRWRGRTARRRTRRRWRRRDRPRSEI